MGNFNILPYEIMLEIFSRVPADSVLECKLVSKPWRKLLENPSFYKMHMNNHPNHLDSGKLNFIFCTSSDENPYSYIEYDEKLNRFSKTIRISFRRYFKDYRIQGSCNGLICINANIDGCYVQPAYICNPITREYTLLPKSEGKHLLTGFGYSPSISKFKVVRICEDKGDPNCGIIQVYTLGSGIGWRDVKKVDNIRNLNKPGVFANGAIHWMGANRTIVAFDLANEDVQELELPSLPCLACRTAELPVLGNLSCAFYCLFGVFSIWVLKKDKNNHVSWSDVFSNSGNVKPIYFTKRDFLLCYDDRDNNFYLYPSKASSSRMLVKFGKSLTDVVPHRNTLVSLKALGEEDIKLMDSGERARSSGEKKAVGVQRRNRRNKKNIKMQLMSEVNIQS